MRVHRQTNRRRVSDDFWRTILRERVRNRLPIDADAVRRLGIACGRDRLTRLRGEVLRELETEFAARGQPPDVRKADAAGPRVVAWGTRPALAGIITEPRVPERARSTDPARVMSLAARSGVAAVWDAMLRLLSHAVRRLAAKGSVDPSRAFGATRTREDNR